MKKEGIIICGNCGAEFDKILAACPYCGTINYEGAEAEYMGKLADIREDMEALQDVPMEETRRVVKRQGSILKKLGIGALVFFLIIAAGNWIMEKVEEASMPTPKEIYIWQETTFPGLNKMFEQGEYKELLVFYEENYNNPYDLWEWEHCDFCRVYMEIQDFEAVLEEELAHEEPSVDRINRRQEWASEALERESLDEEERTILQDYYNTVVEEKKENGM